MIMFCFMFRQPGLAQVDLMRQPFDYHHACLESGIWGSVKGELQGPSLSYYFHRAPIGC